MSMFSEAIYELCADDLLKILVLTKDENNIEVISFVKKTIFPLWKTYVEEAWRVYKDNELEIIKFYENV